ncbi:MAG: hydroxyacid dehydrogenase [Chloroflexi bacterium RBG_13_48_17]|nr:MAG: hydroxyacid dehydrogenase [Chloroflexi bacterium RBG_13_48_17]
MKNIFISTSSFGEYDALPLKLLDEAGMNVQVNPHGRQLTPEECSSLYRDIDGLIAGTEPLTAAVLKSAKNLKVISRCGVGIENIDLEAAKKQKIQIYNTPDAPTLAVAELALGLMLALLRHLPRVDRVIRAGKWQKHMGNLLQGKTVGIIGFGRIGQKVGELVRALGAQVVYCDPAVNKAGYERLSLDELLAQSDIISLHLSGGGKGAPLLGSRELRMMKQGSRLVNCARGGVVSEAALYQVLQEGWLAGAALDVFTQEPYTGPLTKLDNVILTPHIGSYAVESRIDMEVQASKNLIKGLKG